MSDFRCKKIPGKKPKLFISSFLDEEMWIFILKPFLRILFFLPQVMLFLSRKLDGLNIKVKNLLELRIYSLLTI